MSKTEYKIQLVQQVRVSNGDQVLICRWDNVKKVLMFQNRSKDIEMSLDDYLDRYVKTIAEAKQKGFKVEVKDVPLNSLWK